MTKTELLKKIESLKNKIDNEREMIPEGIYNELRSVIVDLYISTDKIYVEGRKK